MKAGYSETTAQTRISNYETNSREPSLAELERLATALGISEKDLAFGGLTFDGQSSAHGRMSAGDVPLIDIVKAGAFFEAANPYEVGDAKEWYPCPVKHGPRTFAVRIDGPSMQNVGSKPSFDPGDIAYIDPDVAPTPNTKLLSSCVIVRLDESGKTTFKQLIEDDGHRYLRPLNPNWPQTLIEVAEEATICGACIGKWVAD